MTVCILVLTLNEMQGVEIILPQIKREWYDRLIVLDGGSSDGTQELVKKSGYELFVQSRPGGKMAYYEVFPEIREDIIIAFSPDGNSLVQTIPLLIDRINEGYDLVIASRYKGGAKSFDDTWLTGLANFGFSKLISIFGYRYTDAMVMYRAYRRELVEKLKLNTLRSNIYEKFVGRYVSWEPLMAIRAAKVGVKIDEIPSDEPKRIDETGHGYLLPTSRISHFKVGLACLFLCFEEMIFWTKMK